MGITDRDLVEEVYTDLHDGATRAAAIDYTALTVPELLALQSQRETLRCAAEAVDHAILAALQSQTTPKALGAKSWPEVLRIRLRIGKDESLRRVRHAALLGPRTGLTGDVLPPLREKVADAVADGAINADHVDVIEHFFTALPDWVDLATRLEAERELVDAARHQKPETLRETADKKLFLLDQDGPEPDDTEPEPERGITLGKQQSDGTSKFSGTLTAEGRAFYQAWAVKFAAPGMCNPADEHPCFSGTPTQEQIDNDHRTRAQREHDAFVFMERQAMSGELGEHNGFPVTIVATCTVEQLEQRAGVALTHTGSHLPVKDLVNLAAQAGVDHYLSVFDNHREIPLYLGRARRTASTGQRLALFSLEGGCSHPDCDRPAAHCQVHHAVTDWSRGGQTNIDELTLACGPHNRLADTGGWETSMKHGRAHWKPPPLLDVGQPHINTHFRPAPDTEDNDDDTGEKPRAAS